MTENQCTVPLLGPRISEPQWPMEGNTDVKLFPEDDEPVNILNIKRGIISALMVPETDKEETKEMVDGLLFFFLYNISVFLTFNYFMPSRV
ncbi:hypothetical protein GOODEAATRI_003099 [Goodea atripinnis]|uniref:Uncharacterized protein n=1 Tax=Goodea atripinnis TaxID=208336 RepID=A0ABV0MYA0_9TELE